MTHEHPATVLRRDRDRIYAECGCITFPPVPLCKCGNAAYVHANGTLVAKDRCVVCEVLDR